MICDFGESFWALSYYITRARTLRSNPPWTSWAENMTIDAASQCPRQGLSFKHHVLSCPISFVFLRFVPWEYEPNRHCHCPMSSYDPRLILTLQFSITLDHSENRVTSKDGAKHVGRKPRHHWGVSAGGRAFGRCSHATYLMSPCSTRTGIRVPEFVHCRGLGVFWCYRKGIYICHFQAILFR